ncbi:hypothetical protein HGRIS_000458 [Hohenbuehelia grisea]|uniref:Glutamine synthetase n=1 Tax=Hohenbuehelia grisea TaxID=104357 RepID=A0ABR3JSQ4_9AGAR
MATQRSHFNILDLDRLGIEFVRIQWVDLVNKVGYKVVPLSRFKKMILGSRPGVNFSKATLGLVFLEIAEGFSSFGEYLYVVDMDSLRPCPYAPGHASVMGWYEEKNPRPDCDQSLAYFVDLCPRTLVRRITDEAKSLGIDFLVGFETEFILLKSAAQIEPVNNHGWSYSSSLRTGSTELSVMEEIARTLEQSGIELEAWHAEASPGQYEVVTGPLPPIQAIDNLVHTREAIYNIAHKHGLHATLAPRLHGLRFGSAAHSHFSLQEATPSGTSEESQFLTKSEAAFLSGVLAHLPAMSLLALPVPASYMRMDDEAHAGGTYVSWGSDQRSAPVRLCCADEPEARNFEFRLLDGVANPYVALAGILGAGLSGIKEKRRLVIRDCLGDRAPADMTEEERTKMGITERMPLTWEEARECLKKDDGFKAILGNNFVDKYLTVNELQAEYFAKKTDENDDEAGLLRIIEHY